MAGICTVTTSPNSCSHRDVTIVLDGVSTVVHLTEDDALAPLDATELAQFIRYGIRRLRQKSGVGLSQFLNRVTHGDEATNVKGYDFFGPGASVTKTNIGSVYVNICPGLNGERILVDFTGCVEFRVIMTANLIGTGAFGLRAVRDSDNVVLVENANLGAAGERELDTDWTAIPNGFSGQTLLRVQAKSVTAADDPVFRRCSIFLR